MVELILTSEIRYKVDEVLAVYDHSVVYTQAGETALKIACDNGYLDVVGQLESCTKVCVCMCVREREREREKE